MSLLLLKDAFLVRCESRGQLAITAGAMIGFALLVSVASYWCIAFAESFRETLPEFERPAHAGFMSQGETRDGILHNMFTWYAIGGFIGFVSLVFAVGGVVCGWRLLFGHGVGEELDEG